MLRVFCCANTAICLHRVMMRLRPLFLGALLCSACAPLSANPPVYHFWSGVGNGWQGGQPPPNDGSAILVFGHAVQTEVFFTEDFAAGPVYFISDTDYRFDAAVPRTLTLKGGAWMANIANEWNGTVVLAPNIVLRPDGQQNIDGANGTFVFRGKITGTGGLNLSGSNATFIFKNDSGSASDYSGGTRVMSTGSYVPTLAIWSDTAFGAGPLQIVSGAHLITHGQLTLNNAVTLNSGGISSSTPFSVRNWTGPLTLAGAITLAANATIKTSSSDRSLEVPDGPGSIPLPGARTRHATIISGAVGESGGARTLTVTGDAPLILTNASNYTGETFVGSATGTGTLVYGSVAAIPTANLIRSGAENTNFSGGYVGIASSTPGDWEALLAKIHPGSSGSVGLDTLPGATSTTNFAGNINLAGFNTTASNGIRLGTATKAIISGSITPQGNAYHFGNGGGSLFVRSNLANGPLDAIRSVNAFSNGGGQALALYLQGTNTYTGGTFVSNGYVIFDGATGLTNSIPLLGSLTAAGSATNTAASYIGMTERVASNTISEVASAMTATEFLGRFAKNSTWGIVGFDTSNPAAPAVVNNLSLAGFNHGVFVGTATAARLTGTIAPTTATTYVFSDVTQTNPNAGNALRFAAVLGGTLTVESQLNNLVSGEVITPLQVVIGSSNFGLLTDGTVVLSGANAYSGGTLLNPAGNITLAVGSNTALGSGALSVANQQGTAGLAATTAGVTLANPVSFLTGTDGYSNSTLNLTGSNDFTLAGSFSGRSRIVLANANPLTVTLSGDNSGFSGVFSVHNGTLRFGHNAAAGTAPVYLGSSSASVVFTTANPTIHGFEGDAGSVVLPNGANLTVNLSDLTSFGGDYDFGGVISGAAGASTTASLTLTGSISEYDDEPNLLYLYGNNNYSGGTSITGQSALALGHNFAAGSGPITINTTEGGVLLNTGVTLTNAIVFQQGGLGGLGTFAPTAINGDNTATRKLTVGANRLLFPGVPGDEGVVGKLTLDIPKVELANGGELEWTLQDALNSAGFSSVYVIGAVDLSLLGTSGFKIVANSIDAYGERGWANMTLGDSYSFAILTATAGITGFNPAHFAFDVVDFQFGVVTADRFNVSLLNNQDGSTSLMLNFTAVPEPSTYALLALGLGFVGLVAWRRRRPS